ncbi:endopeptidase [Hyalangium rubrum]
MSASSWALVPPKPGPNSLASKAFYKPEMYLPITNVHLQEAQARLSSQSASAWNDFFARHGKDFNVYMDLRTGAPTSIQGVIPLLPGKGSGNSVTLSSLSKKLGRAVSKVDEAVVADVITQFIADNSAVLAVDPLQLGEPRVTPINENLWQVHIPQQVNGVSVRHARVAATISYGNLILIGTESWANANISTKPAVAAELAMGSGGDYLGMYETPSNVWKQAALEIIPMTRPETQNGQTFTGATGNGYVHKLVWTYGFQRDEEHERWKVSVDAQTGETLAVEDDNHYFEASVKGGVYPSTNIESCTTNETCGSMQPDSPMPWANTGFAEPNNFTNGAGVYDYSQGTASTTLAGKYVRISDTCGQVTFSSPNGNINMGGVNGNHDCTTGGGGPGNTAAARSGFYELNKLAEQARGWLPNNTWLKQQLTSNMNLNSTCNAFWDGSTVNFYKSGGGCRNTGEIGAVFDHEWGHGIDDFDANGMLSSSSEGYADIAAVYRLQTSCVGYGFLHTSDDGCGQTPDGTGFNSNEAQQGAAWCDTQCSGVRDTDWAKMTPNTPATPQNFSCSRCLSGSGPCGKQVHCAASPARQAAWDFVSRDLVAAPYNYDSNTAFIVANKIFYQGSGNVGSWHGCDCTAGTSDGCGATNAYMQWLAADDDNGNLADGTPHMTAIYAAFNRHNIACTTPAPVKAGCANGPASTPQALATPGQSQVDLSWSPVTGASQYWVMKTEGFAGCDFGKARIANISGTSYVDTEVANGRQYCYSIVAAKSESCVSPASTCTCVTPACTPPSESPVQAGPVDGSTDTEFTLTLDWDDLAETTYDVQVATDAEFVHVVRSGASLAQSTWNVSPALSPETTYYWRVRARSLCGGASGWSATRTFTTRPCIQLATPSLSTPASGATNVAYAPSLDWNDIAMSTGYDVQVALDANFTNVVRSATAVNASNWTVSPELAPNTKYYWRARAVDTCGQSAYAAVASFTTANVCTPSLATFNATLQAPYCAAGCGCDTNTLVRGRGATSAGGYEMNTPNTLNDSCADGNSGRYHVDESIDKLLLATPDKGLIVPGKQVKLDVTVWCVNSTDKLDLYYTTNAATPSWSPLATSIACPGAGAKTISHTFTVGSTPGTHAIRAQLRYAGAPGICSTGNYNERDDLAFTVASPIAQAK